MVNFRSLRKQFSRIRPVTLIILVLLFTFSIYFVTTPCKCSIEGLMNKVDGEVDTENEYDTAKETDKKEEEEEEKENEKKSYSVGDILSKVPVETLQYLDTLSEGEQDKLIKTLKQMNKPEIESYENVSVDDVKKMIQN